MDSQNFVKLPTRFTELKTGSPSFFLVVVKTDSPNIYKPPTQFEVVKTDSPIFYKPPTRFTDVKTDSPNI